MLSCELRAAICLISVTLGHRLVLASFSDFRIAFDESFRFEELLKALRLHDDDGDDDSESEALQTEKHIEEGEWEARTAIMTLINALTTCPESLEGRIELREEFSRRGLNETIVVCISLGYH